MIIPPEIWVCIISYIVEWHNIRAILCVCHELAKYTHTTTQTIMGTGQTIRYSSIAKFQTLTTITNLLVRLHSCADVENAMVSTICSACFYLPDTYKACPRSKRVRYFWLNEFIRYRSTNQLEVDGLTFVWRRWGTLRFTIFHRGALITSLEIGDLPQLESDSTMWYRKHIVLRDSLVRVDPILADSIGLSPCYIYATALDRILVRYFVSVKRDCHLDKISNYLFHPDRHRIHDYCSKLNLPWVNSLRELYQLIRRERIHRITDPLEYVGLIRTHTG